MDRHSHPKYIPDCPRNPGIVNQYMWPQKDTNKYMCYNGISKPIYDCTGSINFSLPLEDYPPVHGIHPEILLVKRPHLRYRGKKGAIVKDVWEQEMRETYTAPFEGVYQTEQFSVPYFNVYSNRVPGYPLPQQVGVRRVCPM